MKGHFYAVDKKDSKRLAARALEFESDTAVRESLVSVAIGDLTTECGAHGAVGVIDFVGQFGFTLFGEGILGVLHDPGIDGLILKLIVSLPSVVAGCKGIDIGHGKEGLQIYLRGFGMIFWCESFQKLGVSNNFI